MGDPSSRSEIQDDRRELIRFLFQRASNFQEIMSGPRFWRIVDQLSEGLRHGKKGKFLADPRSLELFIHDYEILRQAFGEADLIANLRRILVSKDLRTVIREAHGGRIPPRLRLAPPEERRQACSSRDRKGRQEGRQEDQEDCRGKTADGTEAEEKALADRRLTCGIRTYRHGQKASHGAKAEGTGPSNRRDTGGVWTRCNLVLRSADLADRNGLRGVHCNCPGRSEGLTAPYRPRS